MYRKYPCRLLNRITYSKYDNRRSRSTGAGEVLIRWVCQSQIDGSSFGLTEVGKGEKEKYLWEKKLLSHLGFEPLPFVWEASALTTEPP